MMIQRLACCAGRYIFFLVTQKSEGNGAAPDTRVLPTWYVSGAPRLLHACFCSPEKGEKITSVLQVTKIYTCAQLIEGTGCESQIIPSENNGFTVIFV